MEYSNLKRMSRALQVIKSALLLFTLFVGYSTHSLAFTCKDATGATLSYTSGSAKTANVYVNLQPSLESGQNLVVDLSSSISCRNDDPTGRQDLVNISSGSTYGGALTNFTGTVKYYGSSYPFPLSSATAQYSYTSGSFTAWSTQLYLTPVSTAAGVVINNGDKFATLYMYQEGRNIPGGGGLQTLTFTWNLYANNSVVVPTGSCDVSARNVAVTLPDYPSSTSVPIPLTVKCSKNLNLAYYLTGTTTDTASTIFANTASSSVAQGLGVQLSNSNGVIATNKNVALGSVGTSGVSLGLTAKYAPTSGQITAGNVTGVVGVTFVYP